MIRMLTLTSILFLAATQTLTQEEWLALSTRERWALVNRSP
jgi:hypothetical protein